MLPLTVSASSARARLDADAAVDGLEVAVGLAGLGGDAAVDLVDVVRSADRRGRRGQGEGEREGEGEADAIMAGSVACGCLGGLRLWMRRGRHRFKPLGYNRDGLGACRVQFAPLADRHWKPPMPAPPRPKPVVLLILDGWGHREDPTDNALAQADAAELARACWPSARTR